MDVEQLLKIHPFGCRCPTCVAEHFQPTLDAEQLRRERDELAKRVSDLEMVVRCRTHRANGCWSLNCIDSEIQQAGRIVRLERACEQMQGIVKAAQSLKVHREEAAKRLVDGGRVAPTPIFLENHFGLQYALDDAIDTFLSICDPSIFGNHLNPESPTLKLDSA
jgi:hypothetical protein